MSPEDPTESTPSLPVTTMRAYGAGVPGYETVDYKEIHAWPSDREEPDGSFHLVTLCVSPGHDIEAIDVDLGIEIDLDKDVARALGFQLIEASR